MATALVVLQGLRERYRELGGDVSLLDAAEPVPDALWWCFFVDECFFDLVVE